MDPRNGNGSSPSIFDVFDLGLKEREREVKNSLICQIECFCHEKASEFNSDFETFYKELRKFLITLKSKDYVSRW